ncbi:hypothetical protein L9F63_001049, partial [Diploptera punctata]
KLYFEKACIYAYGKLPAVIPSHWLKLTNQIIHSLLINNPHKTSNNSCIFARLE